MIKLIDAQTAATTSDSVQTMHDQLPPISFIAHGLSGDESVSVEVAYADDTFTALNLEGAPVQLTEGTNMVGIYAPGTYRVVKATTSSPVTVSIATSYQP